MEIELGKRQISENFTIVEKLWVGGFICLEINFFR